jgi:hypothetical protein
MLGIVYYLYEYISRDYSIYIFVPVILGVLLYVFHGPLDHWWREKFPIPFDPKLDQWLQKHFRPYNLYTADERKKFQYRLGLYLEARLFQSVGSSKGAESGAPEMIDVPIDFQTMVAAHGIHLSLYMDDYLIGDMDRIFLYKHPFPSRLIPALHNVETHIEDGVLLFNMDHLAHAILDPKQFYNIAYHAYAHSIIEIRKINDLPNLSWLDAQNVSGFGQEDINLQLGYVSDDPTVANVVAAFTFPDEYRAYDETKFNQIKRVFGHA